MDTGAAPPRRGPGWGPVLARLKAWCRAHPVRAALGAAGLLLALALPLADQLLARPLQAWAERTMNRQLKGYTVRIGRAHPHLWRLGLDLDQVVVAQDTHPVPPVADFGSLRFSLLFGELLRFKVAGNLTLESPALHIDLAQATEEVRSRVSLKERGWQRAVESVFPFKLDRVEVRNGSMLYLSADTADKPLQLTRISLLALNIRNTATARGTYPSPVSLSAVMFDTGKVRFQGGADFLREPHVAARGDLHLERVPLDRLNPLAQAYQVKTTGGFLSLDGTVESTPEGQTAHLKQVHLEDLRVDYVHSLATVDQEKAHGRQAVKLARRLRNAPTLKLHLDTLRLTNAQLGFQNAAPRPPYRVFLTQVDLRLENLDNQAGHGTSPFQASGMFMGSAPASFSGRFRGGAQPADFQVRLELNDAPLPSLNDMLMAHGGVDVAQGSLSVFTELTVKDGRVEGYVKPLIRNLRIYDKAKDGRKGFGTRVKMHVFQALGELFKNRSSGSVATVVRISGSTRAPETSEWQVIRKLLGNGLFRAIRPGFLGKEGS